MTTAPATRAPADRAPRRHRRPLVVVLLAATTTVLLAGCSSGDSGAGPDAVQSAQSAAAAISKAVASGTAAASDDSTDIPTPAVGTGDASGSGSGSGSGPCALLSVQQASSLNHVTYTDADSADVGDIGTCDYNPGPGNPEDLTVTVTDDSFCWMALTGSNGPGTAVPGLGDAAFGFTTGLDVKHGDTCLDIVGTTEAESKGDWGPDTAMARIILQKLG